MPGTNHNIETGFIDALSLEVRSAAEDLLKHNTLNELLTMREHGVSDFLHQHYAFIDEVEWQNIIQAVILTKISYFEPNEDFSSRQLATLFKIAQSVMDLPDKTAKAIYQATRQDYPLFASVIKKIVQLQQVKLKNNSGHPSA